MNSNTSRKQNQRLRRLKKKVYKLNYLKEELEDVVQTVSEYSQEVRDIMNAWFKKNNIEHAINAMFPVLTEDKILEKLNEDEIDVAPKNGKIDPWVKEIYRQIANKTHPDKIMQQENLGSAEKDILEKIKQDKVIDKYIENKEIFRTIYVKNKIINIIVR